MSCYSLRADDRQLLVDALHRQHDDLRSKAASPRLAGEQYASLRAHHRRRACRSEQLARELAQLSSGDYVLISRRTQADAACSASAGQAGDPDHAAEHGTAHRLLCAHADQGGRGAHWLRPGEKCTATEPEAGQ